MRPEVADPDAAAARAKARRRQLNVQKGRLLGYGGTGVLAAVLASIGALDASYWAMAALVVVCLVTVAVFHAMVAAGIDERLGISLDPIWLTTDVLLTTAAVAISGGSASPWFIMYLNNALLVSFVRGPVGVVVLGVLNTVAYLALLLAMGHIHPFDAAFRAALGRMVLLNTTLLFLLRAIVDLRRKRLLILQLKEEESRKVAELTRLTTALDERTRALAAANERILEADRLKSAFLASMSHELRTPLNSIIGFSDIAMTRLAGKVDPKIEKFLRNINASGTHLLGLINDLLDLSKIEAGRMELHPEPTDVRALVEGVFAIMKAAAGPRRIALRLEAGEGVPLIEADPSRLRQVLYNLLSNAVKFSPEGGTVTVTLRTQEAAHSPLRIDSLEIAVVDQGIGIDPRDHVMVFEEFRQVDRAEVREAQGTGLGLALVRRLVELHGGRIGLESRLGEGARFVVTLPRGSRV